MDSCSEDKAWALQANDFGSEVIPGAKDMGMHIQAYLYDGYWEDIGTVEAFYEANLALTDSPSPKFRWAFVDNWPAQLCIVPASGLWLGSRRVALPWSARFDILEALCKCCAIKVCMLL